MGGKQGDNMTLEFWLKESQPTETLVLSLLCEEGKLAVFLLKEQGKLIC